jgi:hypothetical protein
MNAYHSPGLQGNEKLRAESALPLFEWAATKATVAQSPVNRAVLRIAAQGRISVPYAAVIAGLMGISMEASQ